MTVNELIEELQELNGDLPAKVYVGTKLVDVFGAVLDEVGDKPIVIIEPTWDTG